MRPARSPRCGRRGLATVDPLSLACGKTPQTNPSLRVAEIDRTPALADDRAKFRVLRRKQSHEAPGDPGNCRRGSFEQPLEIGVEGRRLDRLCFHDLTFVRSLARF